MSTVAWWARGRIAAAVDDVLRARGASAAAVLLVGDAALARALGSRGQTVHTWVEGTAPKRALRPLTALPVERTFTAAIGVGAPTSATAWAAATLDGGALVLVDPEEAAAVASAALLGVGASDIEQRTIAGVAITSGRVQAWAAR